MSDYLSPAELASIQSSIVNLTYNWTVDVRRHNIADDTFTTIAAGVPCAIIKNELYEMGRIGQDIEERKAMAFMYCLPNTAINVRGLVVTPKTVNGLPVNSEQGIEYKILTVQDSDGIGIEWEIALAEEA